MLLDARQAALQSPTPAESSLHQALLKEDPALNDDYNALVKQGIVSEQEFWAQRSEAVQRLEMRTVQATSLPSARLQFQPVTQQDNLMQYQLSDDMIRQTLACEPLTLQTYLELVKPQKLSQAEFWQRYIKARTKAKELEYLAAQRNLELHQVQLDSADHVHGPGAAFFNGIASGKVQLADNTGVALLPALKDASNSFDLVNTAEEVLSGSARGGSRGGFGTREGAQVYDEAAAYTPATDVSAQKERQHFVARLALARKKADRLVLEHNQYSSVVLRAGAAAGGVPRRSPHRLGMKHLCQTW